ncbi:MAG: hypothetical protein H6733_12440 [Alphaproteobacteria bacterium]|nr:hypothetical protein [Alphaproteobacteria bacterium]
MPEVERSPRGERLAVLVALEIGRIVRDLEHRVDFLMTLWSRYRTREPFLDTTFSRWRTAGVADVVELDADTMLKVEAFYAELDHFVVYVRYTEDMPTTLRDAYEVRLRRLKRAAGPALEALGPVPEALASPPPLPDVALPGPGEG